MPKNNVTDPITDQEMAFAHGAAVQQRPLHISRDQILTRLWQIANLSPEMTRGSITGQVKALNMIMALEGLVPDRISGHKQPASPPAYPEIDDRNETADPEPFPAPGSALEAGLNPSAAAAPPPVPHPTVAAPLSVPADLRVPFSIKKGLYGQRR